MVKQQDTLQIEATCNMCNKTHIIDVPRDGYTKWIKGVARIQDVMPDVSADDRELLISGTCGTCFDKLFGGE